MKFLLLLLLPLFGKTQSFYVSGSDIYSVNKISEKIKSEGYSVNTDSTKSDYIINLLVDGAYKYMSLKRSFQGYITIVDRAADKEIYKSPVEKASPSVYNGFNASWRIFEKIAKKYLPEELKNCMKTGDASKK